MTLEHLKCGETAQILGFYPGESAYRQQLLAMGLTPGTVFTLVRIAPLGDPIEIQIRGYALTLRRKEASILRIQLHSTQC